MKNNFSNILLVSSFTLLASFFLGCSDDKSKSSSAPTPILPIYSYAILGPISDANVKIYRVSDSELAYETNTKAYNNESDIIWPQNTLGSFEVDINSSFSDDDLMLVHITSGTDVDPNDDGVVLSSEFKILQGNMYAYTTLEDLKTKGISINIFTTLAYREVVNITNVSDIVDGLTLYAQKIFRLSVNDDNLIDYKDLNSYIPNYTKTKVFINLNIYSQMLSYGLMDVILNDTNLTSFMNIDSDSDGLTFEEEIFIGSSPSLNDTDNDGILDNDEVQAGLDPLNKDSDFDGIDDNNESIHGTNPLNSDSDGDYFPDGVELNNGTDPLNGDEDSNSVLDGLDDDPFFKYQWHIKSYGNIVNNTNSVSTIVGNDLNILDVYHYQVGDGNSTIIQVVDTGVELIHEDLVIDRSRSLNAVTGSDDPTATDEVTTDPYSPFFVGHGTAVAGIIAARANNGKGLRGVVPNAVIAGSNWLEEQSLFELDRVWYSMPNSNEILVSNNSWGTYVTKDKSFEDIMKLSVEQLRGGKGRIFTIAAGNDREAYGNANLSYLANNRYAIAVASLNHNNTYSAYSNPGSNILVSAYAGEGYTQSPTIATTLLTGKSYYVSELGSNAGSVTFDEDSSKSYTYIMNGTSSATPMVSGAIALTLESCPNLTWRDVRWLLSYTSKKIDVDNDKWIKNSAGNSHNINYGFGLIDTDAMIQECRSKYYEYLPVEKSASVSASNLNIPIPDTLAEYSPSSIIAYDPATSAKTSLKFIDSFSIEWLELIFDSNHPYVGDLEIILVSPSGTKTQIITPNELNENAYLGGFRFSSAAFIGENSSGTWSIEVIDHLALDSGNINSVELKIYGH